MAKKTLQNTASIRLVYGSKDLNSSPLYLKKLLEDGADINAIDRNGNTPLHNAASIGRLDLFQFLITNDPDVTILNDKNQLALDIALEKGNPEIIYILSIATRYSLATKLDRDMLLAARLGFVAKVKELIESNANVDTCNSGGTSALHMAAMSGDREVARCLIKNGAVIDILDHNKATPLHMAALYGNLDILKYLIKKGADINALDINHVTPLHYATMNNGPKFNSVMEFLIEKGANPNLANETEFSFLYKVSFLGLDNIVNSILRYIDDINELHKDTHTTALHAAAKNGHSKVAHLLLSAGIDVSIQNSDGYSAYYLARNNSFHDLGNILNSKGTQLISAAANGKLSLVKKMVKKGTDINFVNYYNYNALNLAVKKGHPDVTKFLLEKNIFIITDILGETPLYAAARNNDCEIMKILIDHGVSNQNTNWLKRTAIDYTTECKSLNDYDDIALPLGETLF